MNKRLEFPYEFEEVPEHLKELSQKLDDEGTGKGVLWVKHTKTSCYPKMKKYGSVFYNFQPRPDDIWLVGYPRSGTTLTQEILYLLGTDLNYEKAASQIMDLRFPYLENCLVTTRSKSMPLFAYEMLEQTTEKRFIKSHLGFRMLHPEILNIGCKVVFIARNPKDTINSFAHYPSFKSVPGYDTQILWRMFINNLIGFGNYFDMLECAWKNRNNKNLLIIFYEDLIKDKRNSIIKIADFLEKKLSNDQLDILLDHIELNKFKNNKSVNNDELVEQGIYAKTKDFAFIRHGKIGSWKEEIPKELIEEVNAYVKENLLAIPDFEIPECWKDVLEI